MKALLLLVSCLPCFQEQEPAQPPAAERARDMRGYELHFTGNTTLSERDLRAAAVDEIGDIERRGYRRAEVDDAAFVMEAYYRSRGFPRARIGWEIERRDGILHATFTVDEGPRTTIRNVRIEGNSAFSKDELRNFVLPSDETLLSGGPYFVRGRVDGAPGSIRAVYLARGYLDVEVDEPVVRFLDDGREAAVHIVIREGVAYTVREIEFAGQDQLERSELEALAEGVRGQPFTPRKAQELRARVEERYGDGGYPDASVMVERELEPTTGAVRLAYTIQEGPRVRIAAIRVEGNDRTSDSFVEARLTIEPGTWYSRAEERASFLSLYRSGLFQRIAMRLEGEGRERTLVVTVEELPAREITVEPGYGSYEKLRAEIGFRDRNLFGTGRALRTELEASLVGEAVLVGITDPWFLGTDVELDAPAFFRRREQPSFTFEEVGAALLFRKELDPDWSVTTGYTLRESDLSSVRVRTGRDIPVTDLRIASLSLEPRHDTRDFLFNPTDGGLQSLRFEWGDSALGSEFEFLRAQLEISRFVALDADHDDVLALAYRAGVIVPVGESSAVPLQERFFLGGQDTVRAFEEAELGPLDGRGDPVGGEVFHLANVEWRHRLTGNLWGALFVDAGSVGLLAADSFDDFRWGFGTGIRYLLPVGALRLDLGWNPERRQREQSALLFLSVGMAF